MKPELTESDRDSLVNLIDECGQVIRASCKILRRGRLVPHLDAMDKRLDNLYVAMADVGARVRPSRVT